jgi:glycosyltransferase involved in cell wall biosynthesis
MLTNNFDMPFQLPFICLNMIVKNESKVIKRLIESVINQIDVIVMSDTGSTDNTKEIVNDFVALYKNKKVYWVPDTQFKNFGYNRTYSLKGCVQILNEHHKIDILGPSYILLMDADMIFKQTGNISLKEYLHENPYSNSFHLFQGSQRFYHYNTRIISNLIWDNCEYLGVTHEYIKTPPLDVNFKVLKTDFFIEDIGDGGSKQDKYERDIRLLKQGFIDEPDNERYTFYLANSMNNAGHYEDAIEMYKKRIAFGRWFEEVWYSYYEIGNCFMKLEKPDEAIIYYFKAFDYSDYRIENLYEIVKYYCRNCFYKLAYHLYLMCVNILNMREQKDSILFFKKDVYEYLLEFEFTIIANYYNPLKKDVLKSYDKLLNILNLDTSIKNQLLSNLKFEAIKLINVSTPTPVANLYNKILNELLVENTDDYVNSTPTIVYNESLQELYINIRYVNYNIDTISGNYVQSSYIGSKNLFSKFKLTTDEKGVLSYKLIFSNWLIYNTDFDRKNGGGYVGLEDIRFILASEQNYNGDDDDDDDDDGNGDSNIYYNCNRGVYNEATNSTDITIEYGLINENGRTINDIQIKNENTVEKNWVCFIDKGENYKFIYKWYDNGYLIIGEMSDNDGTKLIKTHSIKSPFVFKELRGSSNGVKIGNELWFICHFVNYENKRYYYHRFVVLDFYTFEILRYSKIWTFEKSSVEYCLSFVYCQSSLIVGYSVMDNTTKIMEISMDHVNTLFT